MRDAYQIQHSLRHFIEDETGTPCVWLFDTKKQKTLPKSLYLIEWYQDYHNSTSKVKETVFTTSYFSIKVFAPTVSEVANLQRQLEHLLKFKDLPILSISKNEEGTFDIVGYLSVKLRHTTDIEMYTLNEQLIRNGKENDVQVAYSNHRG